LDFTQESFFVWARKARFALKKPTKTSNTSLEKRKNGFND